jgi:hypothetical protein
MPDFYTFPSYCLPVLLSSRPTVCLTVFDFEAARIVEEPANGFQHRTEILEKQPVANL